MKKLLLPLLLFMMFIPFYVNAETCELDKITIESIEINNNDSKKFEKSEPTVDGITINLDLKMSKVGDTIEYKMIVKNDSKKDYELDKISLSASSDHIEYTIDTKDSSNIVKIGETKEVLLRVRYKNEVSDDSFINGIYTDSKNFQVNLSTRNTVDVPNTLKNPSTGDSIIYVILLLLIISGITIIILRKKKSTKFIMLFIGIAITVPISVYAICKCEININSNVEITPPKYKVYMRVKSWIDEEKIKSGEYITNQFAIDNLRKENLLQCEDDRVVDEKKYTSCYVYKMIGEYSYLDEITLGEFTYDTMDGNTETYTYYAYPKKFNPYYQEGDKNIMGSELWDTLNVEDWNGETEDPSIYIFADGTFKMPKHDIFIDRAYRYSGNLYVHVVY